MMSFVSPWRSCLHGTGNPAICSSRSAWLRAAEPRPCMKSTHVFAPNAHRFLAEGLAVYAQDRLKGPPAFPNFGIDVTKLARLHAGRANIAASIELLRRRPFI